MTIASYRFVVAICFIFSSPVMGYADSLNPIQDLGRNVSALDAEAKAVEKDFELKRENIKQFLDNAQNADRFIAETLANLKKIAGRLKPDSPEMQSLDQAEQFARKRAEETAASPDPENHQFSAEYDKRANRIKELQQQAGDLATKLSAEIDRFERMKKQIQYAYELQQLDKLINTVRDELASVNKVLTNTTQMNNLAHEIVGPAVPTQ